MKRALLCLTLAPLSGCALVGAVEVPLPVETPSTRVDADEAVAALEARACADPAERACAVLRALDASDGEVADPPRLPSVLPRALALVDPASGLEETVDVAAWLAEQRLTDEAAPAVVVGWDAAAHADLERFGVEGVELRAATLRMDENTLSFATPPLELYVGVGLPPEGADPRALVASGAVAKVARADGRAPGEVGDAALALVDGGTEALEAALRSGAITIVVAVAPGATIELVAGDAPDTLRAPSGAAALSLTAELGVLVDTASLAEAAFDG